MRILIVFTSHSDLGNTGENQAQRIIDAMKNCLTKHRPIHAELRGTFIEV